MNIHEPSPEDHLAPGNPPLFLGLDVGTQSTKAVLIDPSSGVVAGRGASSYGLLQGLDPGHMEQDPGTWIAAVVEAVDAALVDAAASAPVLTGKGELGQRVAGIGVSGQQHGAVLVDEALTALRPAKLWCDTSTSQEAAEISEEFGSAVPSGFTAPKLRWHARHEPDLWARVAHVLLPHDYVNAWATGEIFTEPGDASGTGYLGEDGRSYRGDLDGIAPGLAGRVPPIVASMSSPGALRGPAAEALGLRPGIPLSAGGGDNMMSAIGAGATRPGVVTCSLGTSGTLFAYSERALLDPTGSVAGFRTSSDGASSLGHLPLMCVMNCTGVLETVKTLTGLGHSALTEGAAGVPFGSDGLFFTPFLVGERVPNLPHARGALSGIDGDLTPGRLYRAAIEGVSANLAMGLRAMVAAGLPVEEVRLVGGAAGNPVWRQVLATLFQCPVQLVAETETAAVGAALQAAAVVLGRSADEAAHGFVRLVGDPVGPSPEDAGGAQELMGRLGQAVAELTQGGSGTVLPLTGRRSLR